MPATVFPGKDRARLTDRWTLAPDEVEERGRDLLSPKATQETKSAFVALNEATCYGTLSQGRAAQEGTAHGHGNSFGSDKRACKLTGMTMLKLAPKG